MTRLTKWFGMMIVGTKLALVLGAAAPYVQPATQTVTSRDGQVRLVVPAGWAKVTDAGDETGIRLEDKSKDICLSVGVERKDGLGTKYALREQSRQMMEQSLAVVGHSQFENGPTELRIHGCPAIRYQLTGTFHEKNVTCLYTVVETDRAFYQILAVTSSSHFDRNQDDMELASNGFSESP